MEESGTTNVMTDEALVAALDQLSSNGEETQEVAELLKMMNENRMISWEEAEQIISTAGPSQVVKSGLPAHTRPTEPENETNVSDCITRLSQNDPSLQEVNINNMKRTPVPQIQKLIMALKDNTFCRKLSMANVGLTDAALQPILDVLQTNDNLTHLNVETNFLTGDFLVLLFQSLLELQSLQELKVVNQNTNFSTEAEMAMVEAIAANRGLTKCSINFRRPEGRTKIDGTLIRNGEIRRILRRQEEQKRKEAGGKPPNFKNAVDEKPAAAEAGSGSTTAGKTKDATAKTASASTTRKDSAGNKDKKDGKRFAML